LFFRFAENHINLFFSFSRIIDKESRLFHFCFSFLRLVPPLYFPRERRLRPGIFPLRGAFRCIIAVTFAFFLSGCFFFGGKKEVNPDGVYFEGRVDKITKALVKKRKNKQAMRIVIVDVVNSSGKVSELGRFVTFKIYESFLRKVKGASLVPRGVILDTMKSEGIKVSSSYSEKEIKKLSEKLQGDFLMLGELVDLGVSLELNAQLIDLKSGEIVSATSEKIEKKESVITLFESF
ncbi:MAG: FlgO family outer membrane protein, partial [Nitrospinota bacterium]